MSRTSHPYLVSIRPSRHREATSGVRTLLAVLIMIPTLLTAAHAQEGDAAWELRVCADPNAMPMSHRSEDGFENHIAEIVAEELGAVVTYDWYPQVVDMINLRLREGHCDVIMGVADGQEPLLTSVAYYRSPYVFVYREDAGFEIDSFDDPDLQELRIALQANGIPPHDSLVRRGLGGNVVEAFGTTAYARRADPKAEVIEAVADGTADVGIAWGPIGGYYAARSEVPLVARPVAPLVDPPFGTQVFAMAVGMRMGDDALRDQIGYALARRWDDVQAVLDQYDVVQDPLPRPTPPRELP